MAIKLTNRPSTQAVSHPTPHEWMVDVFEAAEELGFGVEMLSPGSIRVSDRSITITVEAIFLSGDTLRASLRSRREPRSAPLPEFTNT